MAAGIDTIVVTKRTEPRVTWLLPSHAPADVELAARSDTIDPAGASRTPDLGIWVGENVAIADGFRVLVVDSAQKRVATVGRKGQGPGEFYYLDMICRTRGDTLIVSDATLRTTVLSSAGQVIRQFSLPGVYTGSRRCLDDGTIVTTRLVNGTGDFKLERFDLFGAPVAGVLDYRFDETIGGLEVFARPTIDVEGASIFFGDPWVPEVREYSSEGTLVRVFKLTDNPERRSNSGGDYQPMAAARAGTTTPAAPRLPATAKNWPYFGSMRVASNGDIWLKDFPKFAGAPERWAGFDKKGASLGTIKVDSAASADGTVVIADFNSSAVLVRFELETGQVYYRGISFAQLRSIP